jgi:hypothetical protein
MLGRIGVRAVVVLFALAAGAGTVRLGTPSGHAAIFCSPGRGPVVGAVIQVVHSSAFVGGRYVGAAPFDIRSGDRICTDARGQVVFSLSQLGGTMACTALPLSRVLVSSSVGFESGTSWCVARAPRARFRAGATSFTATTDTLFGVAVQGSTVMIKVLSGSVVAPRLRVARSQQVTLTYPSRVARVRLTAEDRLAVAQLSAAIARAG